jgi:hypothetical protein
VEDKDGNPLEGARVELHSDVQVAYTDKNGLATFTNVVGDNHDLVVTYKNTTFTKKLSLLEVSKDSNNNYNSTFAFVHDKTVVEKPTSSSSSSTSVSTTNTSSPIWIVLLIIGILALGGILAYFAFRQKKTN